MGDVMAVVDDVEDGVTVVITICDVTDVIVAGSGVSVGDIVDDSDANLFEVVAGSGVNVVDVVAGSCVPAVDTVVVVDVTDDTFVVISSISVGSSASVDVDVVVDSVGIIPDEADVVVVVSTGILIDDTDVVDVDVIVVAPVVDIANVVVLVFTNAGAVVSEVFCLVAAVAEVVMSGIIRVDVDMDRVDVILIVF